MMQIKYDLTMQGVTMLYQDALKTYDPRDVLLAGALASLTVYIVRYTDAIEAAVDTSSDLLKTLAASGVDSAGNATGLASLFALLVPK